MDKEEWADQAADLLEKGDLEGALKSAERALDLDSEYALAWKQKGGALAKLTRYKEALEAFNQALALDQQYATVWFNRGLVLNRMGRYDEALEAFDQALASDQGYSSAWGGKGRALSAIGQFEKALKAYEQALALDPTLTIAWQNYGNLLLDMERYEEALEAYMKTLELNPGIARAWGGKGNALVKLGRDAEALEAFEKALDLDPESATAWDGKGDALTGLDLSQEALEAYERALDLNPHLVPALVGKGQSLDLLNRYEEALEIFERALDLNPENSGAWHGKGRVLRKLNHHEEALEDYKQSLSLSPQSAPTWYEKGILLSDDLNRPVGARRAFLRVFYIIKDVRHPSPFIFEKIPSIIDYFQSTGSAPLLIVSITERHGLTDVYLQKPSAIRRAYERSAPYWLLKRHFASSSDSESKSETRRKHALLGLAAFYLGDPFLAQEHFDRLDTLDDDFFTSFYYARTYQEYAQDKNADIVIDVSRDRAREVLQRAERGEAVDPKQLYYAGQLFVSGSGPDLTVARQCFEAASSDGFLPAMYMRAWTIQELEGKGQAHDEAVESVLEEEQKRVGQESQGEKGRGFLRGKLPEVSGSQTDDLLEAEGVSEEEVSAAVGAIEKLLWYRAHHAEIIDAIRDVQGWLTSEGRQKDSQEDSDEHGPLPELSGRSPELEDWIANRQHTEVLRRRVNEQEKNVDLAALRARLQNRTKLPEDWLVDDRPSEEWEEWLGERIREDEEGDRSRTYQELITYLALRGQITGGAVLSLSGYLLATNPSSVGDVSEREAADALLGGLLGTGGSKLLSATVASIAPLVGPSLGIATSVAASFIGKRVRESAERKPEYPVFRDEFDKALEGQPDEAYEMIQKVLDQIESRQASSVA